ncbi:B12-binding domain-containing radical SAM protein [Viscerimonas tarda]
MERLSSPSNLPVGEVQNPSYGGRGGLILTTLNAKYIHTSLALRLLYVANKDRFDISFREYVIKEDVAKIAADLLAQQPGIVCFAVYIWNVEQTRKLLSLLKEQDPRIITILGGPEVTYEPQYFIENWDVDFVVSGEGEFVLGELLDAIEHNKPVDIQAVSFSGHISREIAKADLKRLELLPSPYILEADNDSRKNRLTYFESSRGCPYQCQYCLSSLEKGVRYYSQEYIFKNLKQLMDNGAKQIKFLDRTFNLNREHTLAIFDFLIKNYRQGLSIQFEIYADMLTADVIDYLNENLPVGYFRFEVGVQSTYEPTNLAVKRAQNFDLLARNVKQLMDGGKIDIHLDLIAGLPYETYDYFVKSFNDVFALKAKEVQLGFLKMLRGTALRNDAQTYGYRYKEDAPYEVEYNNSLSADELKRIHEAEHALEKYWNSGRFSRTMNSLFDTHYKGKYFELFDEIGQFYKTNDYPSHAYQLEDLFLNLHRFLLAKEIDMSATLRVDYYCNFGVRPHGFWDNRQDKPELKRLRYQLGQDKEFLSKYGFTRKIVEKQTAIEKIDDNEYLLVVYGANCEQKEPLFIEFKLQA